MPVTGQLSGQSHSNSPWNHDDLLNIVNGQGQAQAHLDQGIAEGADDSLINVAGYHNAVDLVNVVANLQNYAYLDAKYLLS